ncbi:SAF domain-containing protein [Paenibacillus ihumii]|uniref:SAF domain-containing protein n=1 Tax=Paenibacillus ihumii TaxID=687436 RepID=UPI0006D83512|nr:SAF domain-containing protein [Paenibacillus ihumii]
MSRIRLRQKQLLTAGAIGGAIILLICLIIGYLYVSSIQKKYVQRISEVETKLAAAEKQLNEERVNVAILSDDYKAGDLITEKDIVSVSVPRSVVPDNAVLEKDIIGKYSKIDLKKNTLITNAMLFEEGITPDDLRNQEFNLIQLPLKLTTRDFVDIRIKFPTGQDYIVLSKKKVADLNNGTVWHQLKEEEILFMSSAIVDAFINDATIYALSYVDPYMQEKAHVTYPPNPKVQELIMSNPNIIGIATMAMEQRNRERLERDLREMPEQERQKYISGKSKLETNNPNSYQNEYDDSSTTEFTQDNPLLDSSSGPGQSMSSRPASSTTSRSEDIFKDNIDSVSIEE